MTNAEEFLSIYNKLDEFMRKEIKVDNSVGHIDLINKMIKKGNMYFRANKEELLNFAKLRNVIVHNPDSREANPIAEPHEIIVSKYKSVMNKVLNPPNALSTIAILFQDLYTTTLNDNALEVMKSMNKNTYTHIPVIENDKIIGVFSENTIFTFFTEKEEEIFDNNMKIKDFIDFIPLDRHSSEIFKFVSRDASVLEIEEIFRNEFRDHKKISAIFITQNGKETEKILGLITPWDLTGYDIS